MMDARNLTLFGLERRDRIDTHRAASRQIGRDQANHNKQQRDTGKNTWVGWRHTEQQTR